jgi:anaerobic magnesium-protoporphyrin IX monomethyl ester cyclase
MRVLLLNPPFHKKFSRPQRSPAVTKSGTLYFPIWLAYCAGVLEREGFQISLLDAPARGLELKDVLEHARRFAPGLVVLDTSTPSIENDVHVAEALKTILPGCFTVMVGTHVSALAEETLQQAKSLDAVARREYEYTIRDLAHHLAATGPQTVRGGLEGIPGLSFKSHGQTVHNPDRPFIKNLDVLPWVSKIYKKHLRIEDYFNPNALYPMVTLITSRGCPFRCSFCVYPQTLTGGKYRFRSVEDVLNEIEFVIRELPQAKSIFFEDDTLTANKKRCLQLSNGLIERGMKIPWTANSRIDLDLETMLRMKAAGCRELCVGFESGDQTVLDTMNKGIKLSSMVQFMENSRKAGLLIHGCFILGFPGETIESVNRTIDLAFKLNPDTAQFYPVMVYPGTRAYSQYLSKGWLTARSYSEWVTPEGLHNCVIRNEVFDSSQLVRLCDLARRKFYLRPRYVCYKTLQVMQKPSELVRTAKAARIFMRHLLVGSRV